MGLAAASLIGGCATSAPRALHVIHTTDVHGHFSEGLRRLASEVDERRAQDPGLLLLDSGDMWSGTMVSDADEGALGVTLFNALAYDAVALGNHELD